MLAMVVTPPVTPPFTRDHSPSKGISHHTSGLRPHLQLVLSSLQRLGDVVNDSTCILDGNTLDIADVVAVAKYGLPACISSDPQLQLRIDASIQTLKKHLDRGDLVYGVTTGFGGSADTRTMDLVSLQRALIQMQNSGILTSKDIGRQQRATTAEADDKLENFDCDLDTQALPTAVVRASMVTRVNSIIRGHSAVRFVVADTILALLRHEITPVVPLRGSISASGDLSPLSYIAGAIEGSSDIFVRCGRGTNKIMSAQQALREAGIEPVTLLAKEGLGLLNGTAFSAGTAALALHHVQELTVLSQILTSMSVEALLGSAESFYPQIAKMRPHPGQIEAAANILAFLDKSKLARGLKGPKDTKMTGLYQDRYALRTSSQWIGPQIEDLLHAQDQIKRELNSTTDNPLIDTETDHILHGGNFQAAVVTSTMDRVRLAIEKLGRMLFAQATEIMDCNMNNGLPANLASDEPSLSFTCKGVDINMASYASELGFLANPVGNHVLSAEMHNQAINSLALISSRYTLQSLDILRIMSAAHLFVACQALDLRVLQIEFVASMELQAEKLVSTHFPTMNHEEIAALHLIIWSKVVSAWSTTTTLDLPDRSWKTAHAVVDDLVQFFVVHGSGVHDLSQITGFVAGLQKSLEEVYNITRSRMYAEHLTITPSYLGDASRRMYNFVRTKLKVRFHKGLVEHPTQPAPADMDVTEAAGRKTTGSQISIIYEALRDGHASGTLLDILTEARKHSQ